MLGFEEFDLLVVQGCVVLFNHLLRWELFQRDFHLFLRGLFLDKLIWCKPGFMDNIVSLHCCNPLWLSDLQQLLFQHTYYNKIKSLL